MSKERQDNLLVLMRRIQYSKIIEDPVLNEYLPIPRIVCLCGSTKFKNEFIRQTKIKSLFGEIVLSVACFPHVDGGNSPETVLGEENKLLLDRLHKQKILLADYVFVINESGYIGSSTRSEIEFATLVGKPIVYLEALK